MEKENETKADIILALDDILDNMCDFCINRLYCKSCGVSCEEMIKREKEND